MTLAASRRALANRRLQAQQIAAHGFSTPAEVVDWLGAFNQNPQPEREPGPET